MISFLPLLYLIGKPFSAVTKKFFTCLLILAPSVNLSVDTLAKAKRLTHFYSVAPLLEKWFTCHHFVRE